jgi:hypothetical protein
LIVSGSLDEAPGFVQLPRWLDMSLLRGRAVSMRVVEANSADEPARVSSFGTFPGDDEKKFCSFCGASANDRKLMLGVSGNICAPCVRSLIDWANDKSV